MPDFFADWYREASLEITPEILKTRKQGIEKLIAAVKNEHVNNLVLLARSYDKHQFCNFFVEPFLKTDSTFPLKNNENLLSVLSAITISEFLAKPSRISDAIAIATICSSFLPSKKMKPPMTDIVELCRSYLGERCVTRTVAVTHKDCMQDIVSIQKSLEKIETETVKANPNIQINQVGTGFAVLLSTLKSSAVCMKRLSENMNGLQLKCENLSEESNLIWWVFGGFSKSLEIPFTKIGLAASCLIAGKDFAELVHIKPGPASAKVLLTRVLTNSNKELKKVKLCDAVIKVPREWREKAIQNVNVEPLICPLYFAIKSSIAVDDGEDWDPVFKKETLLNNSFEFSPSDLAYQFYLETLLLRLLNE